MNEFDADEGQKKHLCMMMVGVSSQLSHAVSCPNSPLRGHTQQWQREGLGC